MCFDQQYLKKYVDCSMEVLAENLSNEIVFIEYNSKKSTWTEIRTVIDALNHARKNLSPDCKIEIYTDCQSLCDLLGKRKEQLKKRNFLTRAGKVLQNASLYEELFEISENFQIQTVKIKGHSSLSSRLTLQEKIFAVLDRFSRKKLRSVLNSKV